jgi:putative amide transporter protein
MTLVLIAAITMMWFPVGLFFLGTGDPKTCGMMTLIVGTVVTIGGFAIGIIPPGNLWDSIILLGFGLLYLVIAHALLWGVENMKSVGNASLMLAILCAIYCVANFNGFPNGLAKVAATPYLAFMFATFTVLLVTVWANCYGKVSGTVVGWMLLVLNFICLLLPVFDLMLFGKLPF